MKTKSIHSVSTLIIQILFSFLGESQAQTHLYKITGNGLTEPSYLFGTYHVVGHHFFNAHPEVMAAFIAADAVQVEVVIDSTKMQSMAMAGVMQNNTLADFYDSLEYARVDSAIQQQLGYPLTALERLKPMNISVMLSLTQIQNLNNPDSISGGIPMDLYFAKTGRQTGKKVLAFETMEEQADFLFNSTTLEEQAQELLYMIDSPKETMDFTKAMNEAYLQGDSAGIAALYHSFPQSAKLMSVIVDERNANWIQSMPSTMENQSVFIAVGALHLYGEQGLISALKKMNYTVERILP